MYVKYVELYSCEDICECESDSVSRELTSLSLIAINLSLTAAPLNFNFFLGGGLALGLPHFGVDVLPGVISDLLCSGVDIFPGVTSFLRTTFIAPKATVVLIDSGSIESISNVLSNNKATIGISLNTSATVLYTAFGFGLCENDLN